MGARRLRWGLLFCLGVAASAGSVTPGCQNRDEAVRAPDVPYEPSPQHVVQAMLRLAEVKPEDVVFDLGCGDGRIAIAAARDHGARSVCIDIDPKRTSESLTNARAAGVSDRVAVRTEDLFQSDIRSATVVTLFLWPKINLRLRPKLLAELAPGTRVVSYMHDMGDWKPEKTIQVGVEGRTYPIHLWRIPARSAPPPSPPP